MRTLLAGGLVVVGMVGWSPCASPAAALSTHPSGWYVATAKGVVSVIDPAINRAAVVGSYAGLDVALSPDHSRLYVTSGNVIGVVDTRTSATVSTIVGPDKYGLGRIAISPDGSHAAVSTGYFGEVLFFDVSSERFVGSTALGEPGLARAQGVAYSADGRLVYATATLPASPADGMLMVVNAATLRLENAIALPGPTRQIIIADGNTGYVASGRHLIEIDLVSQTVQRSLDLHGDANDIGLAPNGRYVFVAGNQRDGVEAPVLITVDLDSYTVVAQRQLATCGTAQRLATARDGHSLAVVMHPPNVLIHVDLDTGTTSALTTDFPPTGVIAADLTDLATASAWSDRQVVSQDRLFTCDATIDIAEAVGAPGESVDVAISIDGARDLGIAGIQNEIIFDGSQLIVGAESPCVLDPTIDDHTADCDAPEVGAPCKELFASTFSCSDGSARCPAGLEDNTFIRNVVLSLSNLNPIPNGVVYRCRFRIPGDAIPGTTIAALCNNAGASTGDGDPVPVTCSDGHVMIVPSEAPSPTPAPAPTATTIIERPRGQVASEVTTTTFGDGCQVTPSADVGFGSFLLLLPLLTLFFRSTPLPQTR